MRKYVLISTMFFGLIGCAKSVKPTVINSTVPPADALNTAVRVLAQHGLAAASVDRAANVVQSKWQATNYMYGDGPTNRTAYIVRRFTITVTPSGVGSRIMATVEDMRCEDPGAFVSGPEIGHGNCLKVEGVVPPDQKKLDAIAQSLRQELQQPTAHPAASPSATPPPPASSPPPSATPPPPASSPPPTKQPPGKGIR